MFAGLVFLVVLAASASPEVHPGSGSTSLVQVARVLAPVGPDSGLLNRVTLVNSIPLAPKPVDEARREAGSKSLEEFSGGPTGALLIGAALLAAIAVILAVVIPW
jgi:hypothetical protein